MYNFRTRVVNVMLAKKLIEAFAREWKAYHGGKEWNSETDAERMIQTISSQNGPSEYVLRFLRKPLQRWPVSHAGMALSVLLSQDVDALLHRISIYVTAYEEWSMATQKLSSPSNAKAKRMFAEYSDQLSPVLESVGYTAAEVSDIMNQTDFAPNAKADSNNETLQRLKGEGNEAYKEKQFEVALSKYSAALELPNLSDDSRAILLSNSAACRLELKDFAQARKNAKKAILLKQAWFKPYLWYFRASNALSRFEDVLNFAGVLPNAFPREWLERTEVEVQYALTGYLNKEPRAGDARPNFDRAWATKALAALNQMNEADEPIQKEITKDGSMRELQVRCFGQAERYSKEYAAGKISGPREDCAAHS